MRALAAAAALAAVAAPVAQSGTSSHKPVVVVAKKGLRLLAWDSGRTICTEIVAIGHSSSSCGSPRRLGYEQLPYAVGSETFVGGVVSSKARTVDVLFANGAKLTVHAQTGRRYQGRRHGRVRFFAGKEKAVTTVSGVVARDAKGNAVQSVGQTAPPQPVPSPPPNPCTCPPTPTAHACPLIACAYPQAAWTSR
jgi:hypothetical protein